MSQQADTQASGKRIVPRGVVYLTFSQYDDSEPEPDRSVSRDGQADNGIIADG